MQLSTTQTNHQTSSNAPTLGSLERAQLVEKTLGLVHSMARRLSHTYRFPMDREDLVSCGMRGLLAAATAFDTRRGTLFKSYAYSRIRGAMLDGLRDGEGRNTRSELSVMKKNAAVASGSEPNKVPAALESLTVSVGQAAARRLAHRYAAHDEANDSERLLDQSRISRRVQRAIADLPSSERQVVELFYYRCDNSFEAVAEKLGVTRPHIFRIHARAVSRLKQHLADLAAEENF